MKKNEFSNKLHTFKTYGSMALFTVPNGSSKLLIRFWNPFCSNLNDYQVCAGGVNVRATKMIRLRVRETKRWVYARRWVDSRQE